MSEGKSPRAGDGDDDAVFGRDADRRDDDVRRYRADSAGMCCAGPGSRSHAASSARIASHSGCVAGAAQADAVAARRRRRCRAGRRRRRRRRASRAATCARLSAIFGPGGARPHGRQGGQRHDVADAAPQRADIRAAVAGARSANGGHGRLSPRAAVVATPARAAAGPAACRTDSPASPRRR